jgi:lipopolysaccharide export LptBFGC system permease protein LptF
VTPRIIAAIVGIVMVVLLLTLGPQACTKWRSLMAQSRVDQSQAEAAQNSAAEAIGTVARSGEYQAASEAITRDNYRDIRAAQGSDQHVTAAVQGAGLVALCRRDAYKDAPKCAVFRKDVP